MTTIRDSRVVSLLLIIVVLACVAAAQNDLPKPSTFAPAGDLAAQVNAYVEQVDEDLASEADYGDEQKDRVLKAANTLIVLAQVLANHDEEHELKKAAPAILDAAKKLANASDFAAASAAQMELKAALTSTSDMPVEWTPVANLPELMKQVPIVNNKLRSGVNGNRFKRLTDQNAGLAATLAAIAEASRYDKDYCSGEDEEAQWAAICASMRDAAAEVNTAIRKQDQEAAKAGLARLVTTCDECHHAFRD